MSMSEQQMQDLEAAAKQAATHAYCVYSNFAVGAAVLGGSGAIYSGCNVENASYGLTICAERNAIFQAVARGERSLEAIAIYTPTPTPAAPCGACRQVIREFGPQATVRSLCDGPEAIQHTIDELLPKSFGPENLGA